MMISLINGIFIIIRLRFFGGNHGLLLVGFLIHIGIYFAAMLAIWVTMLCGMKYERRIVPRYWIYTFLDWSKH
jgi:hypothetical protein